MTAVLEVTLAYLLQNKKGRDAKSFYTRPAFADFKEQTIEITSPDCGPTPANLSVDYTADADGTTKIPILEWKAPESIASSVKQWLLVVEDPDAPIPTPACHGIYAGIALDKNQVEPKDFEVQDKSKSLLKGGFHYGKNMLGVVYGAPRPLMNHGVHRYFFQVVALSEPLDKTMLESKHSRQQVADAIVGKVLGWGMWVGSCERKWS